jgi:uncharacterized membrane protein YeaQ/YmgE (transglycosylase-associated protein family)
MLILAIIVGGVFFGWIAQLLLGRRGQQIDWALAMIAGLGGSFVGGLLISLLSGDGLALRPSGIIGSIAGAVLVTFLAFKLRPARPAPSTAQRRR